MKSRAIVIAALVMVLLALLIPSAPANHSWGGYHWGIASIPASEHDLTVVDSTSGVWGAHLASAETAWNASTVLNLVHQSDTANSSCGAILGRVRVCNGAYGTNGWLGIAQIWLYSGTKHIAQGTAKMNDTYFNTEKYNTADWRQMVVCQEIAHDFGLDHQDENFNNANLGSCMDYTSDPDGPPSNVAPNQHDFDQLLACYTSHNDYSPTSCASKKKRGNGNAGHSSVQHSRAGQYDVVTFILWVS